MDKIIIVAIDGPAGAGKSTIARSVAERLGFLYIDTGAMYRAIALWALRTGTALEDMHRLEVLAVTSVLELIGPGRILLNGEDVSDAIREPAVSEAASKVAVVAATFTSVLATDVLTASTTGVTTFYDGTNVLTGRTLADDVIDVELTLIFGGPTGGSNPGLTSDHVNGNDKPFLSSFPYLASPH